MTILSSSPRALVCALALLFVVASAGAEPLISVQDIAFGEVGVGVRRQLILSICNAGDGQLTFANPNGPVVTGLGSGFSVAAKDLERLAAARLNAGQCFQLGISFISQTVGSHATTIRIWASTRSTRDTAVLRATVTDPRPSLSSYDFGSRRLARATSPCTKNAESDYVTDLTLENLGTGSLTVARIELGGDGIGGAIRLDTSDPARSIRPGDVLLAATANDTPRLVQRIRFAPDAERAFIATLAIMLSNGATVRSTIAGAGIESHIAMADSIGLGTVAASALPVRQLVTVTSSGRAPVTITGARISGSQAFAVAEPDVWPITLAPGESRPIAIELRRAADGPHSASLVLEGDFSRCDDSTTTLTAVLSGVGGIDEPTSPGAITLAAAPSVATRSAVVRYALSRAGQVRLELLDALGRARVIESAHREGGTHELELDVSDLAAGQYHITLIADGRRATCRLTVVR